MAANVSETQLQHCAQIIADQSIFLKVKPDPKHVTLRDGIYFLAPKLQRKWILSVYRDRCLEDNDLEIALDPSALAKLSVGAELNPGCEEWIEYQRGMLENRPGRQRIKNLRVNSVTLGFKLTEAYEFLRRLAKILEQPCPVWSVGHVCANQIHQSAVTRMMRMAYQTEAASGIQHVDVAKIKKVCFESEEEFAAYLESLLRGGVCAITKLPLDFDYLDTELAPSLDRIDSNGHYEPGNLQVVARFVNRWKSDDDADNFQRLIGLVRYGSVGRGQ